MQFARRNLAAAVVDGLIYAIGGFGTTVKGFARSDVEKTRSMAVALEVRRGTSASRLNGF